MVFWEAIQSPPGGHLMPIDFRNMQYSAVQIFSPASPQNACTCYTHFAVQRSTNFCKNACTCNTYFAVQCSTKNCIRAAQKPVLHTHAFRPHPSHPDNTIPTHAKQPIPAHQMNLQLIHRLFASNIRPRQVKRYEPLCGSCSRNGSYLFTCRGHQPMAGSPWTPSLWPPGPTVERPLETASEVMLPEAVSSLISPYLKQQIYTHDTTSFPS